MSALHHYITTNTPNTPKIWNNAAFDDPPLSSDGSAGMSDWSVLQPISINQLDSLDRGKNISTKEEINKELEKTEKEIERLTHWLEKLKSKKALLSQKPGRVVPSKFMEISKIKFETPVSNRSRQRGVSLGPLEIQQGSAQSSKKFSSSMKPQGIKEVKERSQPWKSAGPKIASDSRPSRRGVSLGPTEISAIARKTPFKSGNKLEKIEEKLESNRRLSRGPRKPRVVPSRYSLAPAKVVREEISSNCNLKKSPESITKKAALLPKIKAVRYTDQSPRDSGRAKRVADLTGRKPFFQSGKGEQGISSYRDLFEV